VLLELSCADYQRYFASLRDFCPLFVVMLDLIAYELALRHFFRPPPYSK